MKQKLVTIYLDNAAYTKAELLTTSHADQHGLVEEHLQTYLDDGWRVVSIAGFGGNSDALTSRGWFAVVLEK